MMEVKETLHTCSNCQTKFNAATLSDFSYGEFLLWSRSNNCNYVDAIEDISFNEIRKFVGNYLQKKHLKDDGAIVQRLYGELTCDVDEYNNPFRISFPPCPNCGSTKMAIVSEDIVGNIEVAVVTHNLWNLLTEQEKEARVIQMLQHCECK